MVAEYAIDAAVAQGKRAFYTAPIKALSNQKYHDLAERLGPQMVGLLTGDNSINGDAPVVVMTTEVLRNMIYARSPALDDLAVVVLDEVHFLQDTYRGPVWEEVIIHLPVEVRLVCLSATVSNAEELAEWITTVRGHTAAVVEERRPVQLDNLYLIGDKTHDRLHLLPTLVHGRPNPEAARLDAEAARNGQGSRRRGPPGGPPAAVHPVASRGARPPRAAPDAAGDLLHLQPQPVRRGGQGGHGCRRPVHHRRGARADPRDRRRPPRRDRTRPTSPCSATASSSPSWRPASPPTTPGWCRRSRRSSRPASSRGW